MRAQAAVTRSSRGGLQSCMCFSTRAALAYPAFRLPVLLIDVSPCCCHGGRLRTSYLHSYCDLVIRRAIVLSSDSAKYNQHDPESYTATSCKAHLIISLATDLLGATKAIVHTYRIPRRRDWPCTFVSALCSRPTQCENPPSTMCSIRSELPQQSTRNTAPASNTKT